MKISQLLQVVLVSSFVAVPGMAVASDSPLSLCGGDKADKAEKAESSEADEGDTTVKAEKKNDKKDNKEAKKEAGKDSA